MSLIKQKSQLLQEKEVASVEFKIKLMEKIRMKANPDRPISQEIIEEILQYSDFDVIEASRDIQLFQIIAWRLHAKKEILVI